MKSGFFKKSKLLMLFGLSMCLAPITSCSAFFGGDEFTIIDKSVTTDEETGDTIVTITFSGDSVEPLTFRIPSVINGKDGVGIESIVPTIKDNSLTLTISYTSPDVEDTIITVPVLKGVDGKGISNVEIQQDENGNSSFKLIYTDGTESSDILIPKGNDGVGIKDITFTASEDNPTINILTITFTDETIEPKKFVLRNGVSISDFYLDEENSTDEFYRIVINFSDGSSQNLDLPKPQVTEWISGTVVPDNDIGKVGDFYINLLTGDVYTKFNDNNWEYLFSIKGSGGVEQKEYFNVIFNLSEDEYTDNLKPGSQILCRVLDGETLPLEEIPIPKKDGYIFEGWFAGSDSSNPNVGKFTNLTIVSNNIDLFARWGEL